MAAMFNDSLSDYFKEQTRLAVEAERERCAKIAEGMAERTADGVGEIFAARKIANLIRGKQ